MATAPDEQNTSEKGESMTCRNEDNIVRRALIALLAPKPLASEATANTYTRKKEVSPKRARCNQGI